MFRYPLKYIFDIIFLAAVLIVPFWAIWESIQKQPPQIVPDGRSVSDQPALPDHQ